MLFRIGHNERKNCGRKSLKVSIYINHLYLVNPLSDDFVIAKGINDVPMVI